MYFSVDFLSLAFLATTLMIYFWIRSKFQAASPLLYLPETEFIKLQKTSHRIYSPEYLMNLSFIFFLLAFVDPHIQSYQPSMYQSTPKEGSAIFFVLDRSSSMKTQIITPDIENLLKFPSKLEVLKSFVYDFIKERPADLVGLVAFSRTAQILSPLTLEHSVVLKKLGELQAVSNKEEDGSAIGYAIFKTSSIISATKYFSQAEAIPNYLIKDAVMIIISDGIQETHPEDRGKRLRSLEIEDAARYAKSQNIRIYFVSVAKEMEQEAYEPYKKMLERSTLQTGGRFYSAATSESLKNIFIEIGQIEKSVLPQEVQTVQSFRKFSFYPFLIGFGMILLFASLYTQLMIVRRIP